jgi:hypothetical protein
MAAVPLFKTGTNARYRLDDTSFRHYYRALRFHAKTLATFRSQVQVRTKQMHSTDVSASATSMPRSLLITTMLATVFELQHGNTDAVDKLAATCVDALRHSIMREGDRTTSSSQYQSQVAASLDDEGIVDAELYLIRRITMSSGSSPMMPSGRESILQVSRPLILGPRPPTPPPTGKPVTKEFDDEFSRRWWQFFTFSTFWYFAAAQRPHTWDDPVLLARLRDEQSVLVARVAEWVQAAITRRDLSSDPQEKVMQGMFVLGTRVLYICTACAFDLTGAQWRTLRDTWLDIKYMALSTLRSTSMSATDGQLNAEYMILGMLQIVRECRDADIRQEALAICRTGLAMQTSSGYLETMVMGTAAVVAAEEEARQQDHRTGEMVVPRKFWYHWSASSWNPDHTELLVTMISKLSLGGKHPEQRQTVVRREDWDARASAQAIVR